MAGRGRGRGGGGGLGAGNKALVEQLGLQKSELIKEPSSGPPETFPSLQFRPVKVSAERSDKRKYMLVVKKDMRDYLQNSEYAVTLDTKKPDIERYSDRFHCLNSNSNRNQLILPWARFPRELRPRAAKGSGLVGRTKTRKRKQEATKGITPQSTEKRRTREVDVKEKLEELEKRERVGGGGEEEGEEDQEEEEGGEGPLEEVEEDLDEEMDEGTDYINSYFDNGEEYLEDDGDPLEEGGVF